MSDEDNSSDSDYNVEAYIKPKRVRRNVNDDSADILGNFDDQKRKEIFEGTYVEKETTKNPSDIDDSSDNETNQNASDDDVSDAIENSKSEKDINDDNVEVNDEPDGNLTKDQLASLLRGTKANRHVLYVTNLNFDTTKDDLDALFSTVGTVKSVRIPKKRRGGFAFVEMTDLESYKNGLKLHNSELQGRRIKVQISEAGKKKSANKKNIIKQKNRKLAEMRNEQKAFTKSGKFYDKNLKKEKAKDLLARKRWRKKPAPVGGNPFKK